MQWFIVFIIIICAITYASLRIYKTLTSKNSACSGCPLKDACSKNKTNITCTDKNYSDGKTKTSKQIYGMQAS